MTDLPEPFTPPNCDLRDFPRMMIDIGRLRLSSFDAIIDDAAWRAGVNLWMSAWHSVPAGSLDDDEGALTKAAGLGRDIRTWQRVRDEAMRGFSLCIDGRYYHETVCEFALEAWIEKLLQRLASGAGNAKRWKAEFDPAPLEEELALAGELLTAIAPGSKSIVKTRRRPSQRDAGAVPVGIPVGRKSNPTGKANQSHRDGETIPPASHRDEVPRGESSQEKRREEKEEEAPLPPAPPPGPSPNPRVAAVMHAGGFVSVPSDLGLVSAWIQAGADFDKDVIPTLERVRDAIKGRNGRAPFKLQLFDPDIRQLLAARADQERQWKAGAEAIRAQDQRQAAEDQQDETPEQIEERQRQYRESLDDVA